MGITIKAKELSRDNFAEYGSFVDIMNPRHPFYEEGTPQFYPDRLQINLGNDSRASISISLETKRDVNRIEFAEIHHNTSEGMLCLDDDVIIYCAPATEEEKVPVEFIEAFYVPKGTFVELKMGVWHGCQFPVHNDKAHIVIVLPERTYAKDCVLKFFDNDTQPIIEK